MANQSAQSMVRVSALALAVAFALLFVVARALPVAAGGTVLTCDESSLRAALAGGGSVTFACGSAPTPITLTSQFVITAPTSIDGSNAGSPVTLGGGGTTRLFVVNAGAALTLTNITIRDANSPGNDGGAIKNLGSLSIVNARFFSNTTGSAWSGGAIESFGSLSIKGSEFAYNGAGNGGVLFPRESTSLTTISGSSFHDNYTTNATNGWGGVMLVWNGAQMNVDSTSFISNTARQGGAVYVTSVSAITVTSSSLMFNHATDSLGGAIYSDGTATLNGTTLSGNAAPTGSGGAIANLATATLNNVTISGNSASQFGGGIDNTGGLTVTESILSGNTVTQTGGALYNVGTATLNNSTLRGNVSAAIGGGIAANIGTMTLNYSTLSGNSAGISGGGIYSFGNVNVNASTLSGNWAGNGGGGFYNDHSIANVVNSTFSGNATATKGGGFYNSGQAVFENATLADNPAASGGALYIQGSAATVLTNTILAYSTSGGNCSGTIAASKFTFSSDTTCALPATNTIKGQDPNGLDPLLTALGNYGGPTLVHMIKSNSPARDGVVGNDAPLTDQRGDARPQLGGFDIGAVERQPSDVDTTPWLWLPLITR